MTTDQNAVLWLIETEPDAVLFFEERYPEWREYPEVATAALKELREFGIIQ